MLTVAVLGPTEVRRDGERLPLPSGKTTEVLVRLAVEAGRPVRAERITEDLWACAATGKNTLQSKVSQLRRALAEPGLVTSGKGGYTLNVDPDSVDALHVVALAASATASRRTGDAAAALEVSTDGLVLFRGEVLVDAGEGDWLQPHRARLEEVRLGLLEDQLAARVDLGLGGDVIGELEGLVAQYPLREGLWCCLITALYRMGRQADALAAYTRVRELLVDELGIDPGPNLRALEEQILQQSRALDSAGSRPTVRAGPVGNLPGLSSSLVGRAAEVSAVHDLLRHRRLVTVVGPAGVGKTRLAIEVARGLTPPGGTWLVRLDAVDTTTSIPRTVAETLHLPGGKQMLVERFTGAETVLVLDNCEHVVDRVAELTSELLDAAPQLRVLVTGQVRLDLDGEAVYQLAPLPIADSVSLFASRAAEIRKQFVLDVETTASVEEVCLSLDGLPLAIELAAARARSLSVQDIARRLDDRFALLQDPTSRRPERRRALAAAIGWSYELLFPDEQRGLWALSCFADGASLNAAEHVLAALGVPEASVVDIVDRLADRSLVSVEVTPEGAVRYRLLDSIRDFALDRLRASGLVDDARAAHAGWLAEAADRCDATVRGKRQSDCLAVVRAERANIDAALTWSADHDQQLGVRLATGFGWAWVVHGDGVAAATRVRGTLQAAGSLVTTGERATGLLLAGWLETSAGNLDQAEADLDEALGLVKQLALGHLRADAHRHLAFLRIQQGRPQDALELATASLTVYRPLRLNWEVATSLVIASYASIMLGDTTSATEAANEARQLLTPIGDSWALVHADGTLGVIAQADGRLDEAVVILTRAAAASERLGFLGQAALHLTTLGQVEQRAGNTQAAIETLQRALVAAGHSGDLRIAATARVNLARLVRASGQPDTALILLEQTDRWYRASGGGDGALLTRCLLASLSSATGSARAAEQLASVLEEALRTGDAEVQVLASDALARLAADRGDLTAAQRLLESADDLSSGIPHVLDDLDRIDARLARLRISNGFDQPSGC
ncbi:BTAD domain-containing putative transcriptional regulator [Streptomyces sp. NPDC048441]|uniref:BTAD domain-containing putative transcriptional regulator n=1 Tax=Streptomyces sp. NPDC048441 TaxID=3365552 RepID=UPI0037161843